MRTRVAVVVVGVVALMGGLVATATPAQAIGPTPPGQPATGYGSAQGYVATSWATASAGSTADGTAVTWYVPNVLRGGSTAPVVVYLHGFSANNPSSYTHHIAHLARQGLIVIFPQYNKGGLNLFSDNDQNLMLSRAIASTNVALNRIGPAADRTQVHLFGHSLGGLLAAAWTARGGVAPVSATFANPAITTNSIPAFVNITPINVGATAPATRARSIILTGDKDNLAPQSESVQLYGLLTSAANRVVYRATSSLRTWTKVKADHVAPLTPANTLDYRYYFAALDANIAGATAVSFDMGRWSDGVVFPAPVQLAP